MSAEERSTVVVRILDQEYRVEGEGDPATILEVAQYVDRKMRQLSGEARAASAARIGVLTALNIAEELFRERESRHAQERELDQRLRALVERLAGELDETPRAQADLP